jgi:hypothetical protein
MLLKSTSFPGLSSIVSTNAFRSNGQKTSVFCLLLSTCTPPKRVRVWSIESLLLNKNRQQAKFYHAYLYDDAAVHLLFVNCPPAGKQGVFGRFCGRKHAFFCRRIEKIIIIIIIPLW